MVAKDWPRNMTTGDVHIAIYDFGKQQTYISHGLVDDDGHYLHKAHNQPYLRFNNQDLWNEPQPDLLTKENAHSKEAVVDFDAPVDNCWNDDLVFRVGQLKPRYDSEKTFKRTMMQLG